MKLKFKPRAWLPALLMGILAVAAQFYAGRKLGASLVTNAVFSGGLGLAAALAILVRVELKSWWSVLAEIICTAFAGLFLLHYTILNGSNLLMGAFLNNMGISLAILLALTALIRRPRIVCAVWLAACWLFGMMDCAVMQFRGNLIVLNDIYAVGTALKVLPSYRLEIMPRMITTFVVFVIVMMIVILSRVDFRRALKWPVRAISLALACLAAWMPVSNMKTTAPRNWGREAATINGLLMEALVEAQFLRVSAPEGYTTEKAHALLEQYAEPAACQDPPHVIAIMVEALSDLTVGGAFETDVPVMPFTSNFVKDTIHGCALTSVYAGGTSSSEWEFLTGNSMAFVPSHANAYRQFVRGETNSLVSLFKDWGYRCVAMHPYLEEGWDRYRVYPLLGFDETYFLDDLEWGETVRTLVSDSAMVEQMIQRFEAREDGEKMFLFGVTMQNHSPYSISDFESTVRLEGMQGDYPDVEQYLSLLQHTDAAIEKLIAYFKGCGERVQIVVFGDHQPKAAPGFYGEIGVDSVLDQYVVPYFMWKNYEDEAGQQPLTSLNYLPAMMLDSMDADMPAYYRFLNDIRKDLPAICALSDLEELPQDALEKYRMLQYANMFDEDADDALFGGK